MINNQRNIQRLSLSFPIDLIFGTQITLHGQIKDLSLKSAFIIVKSSIHMDTNDELKFSITGLPDDPDGVIEGSATISRVAPGEGIAIYFTKMDERSTKNLQRIVGA